jgi:hypothetical protein
MQGRPARVLSPWIDRNISEITMSLSGPARGFFLALMAIYNNDREYGHQAGRDKAKGLESVPEPVKHEDVAECHGNRRQYDDEKATIHRI